MKIIIIEGPDNTGKNTLINSILENNEIVKVIHCSKPITNNPFMEQCMLFGEQVLGVLNDYRTQDVLLSPDVIVFNRAWYGEYVYGQLYRDGDPDNIKEMINILEDNLDEIKSDIYYVQLSSTSAKLLKKNDDNKSLSKAKITNIRKEIKLFEDIYKFSKLNKKIIYINNEDEFRDKQDILNEFNDFINEHN